MFGGCVFWSNGLVVVVLLNFFCMKEIGGCQLFVQIVEVVFFGYVQQLCEIDGMGVELVVFEDVVLEEVEVEIFWYCCFVFGYEDVVYVEDFGVEDGYCLCFVCFVGGVVYEV